MTQEMATRISTGAGLLLLCGSLTLLSCSTAQQALKAKPAPTTSRFLPQSERMTEQRERFPFHQAWVKAGINRNQYTKIWVRPVNTSYLSQGNWWQEFNLRRATVEEDAKKIAQYTQQAFEEAVRSDPNQRFQLVGSPDPQTVVLEIAIVELVPNKAAAGGGAVAALAMQSPAGAVLSKTIGKGSVAIEARLRDGASGETIGMMADRESSKVAPVDLAAMSWYRHAEKNIDDWASQFIELVNTPPDHAVKDSSPFTLKPW